MKVAIVHDWLTELGGAEKVLSLIYSLYPQADVFTLVNNLNEQQLHEVFGSSKPKIIESFISKFGFLKKRYRKLLFLFPIAIEQFDLSGYDLVISSSYCAAKGVITSPRQIHICYCHSPARYAWDLQHQYLKESSLDKGLLSIIAKVILFNFRRWDVTSTHGVDQFIANSHYVKKRIKKVYGKDSIVIHPNVAVEKFTLESHKQDYYFAASRLVPYKKISLIAEVFADLHDKRLLIAGDGPEYEKISEIIKSKNASNIEMLGRVDDHELNDLLSHARAFVYAAEEDFGILPVEAQACGTPVICLGYGGTAETVINMKTGIHFNEQTKEKLLEAILLFEQTNFIPEEIRKHSEQFSTGRFISSFMSIVNSFIPVIK